MGNFRLYDRDKATGIVIGVAYEVWINPTKYLPLPHPVFNINFFTQDKGRLFIVGVRSLKEAKSFAERFYEEWMGANVKKVDG